ncbi:MAG: AAA family ATPase [Clostridiales bacterium]|nr:AAA family ATPase [Clostridiales bacterium]
MNELFLKAIEIDRDRIPPNSYINGIEALSSLDRLEFRSPVTFFVGENGSGKSTLLEAIAVACGFNPEGGSRANRFSTYDTHSDLFDALKLTKTFRRSYSGYFLRAESFYNVATMEAEANKLTGGRPQRLHERSHGESFLYIAQSFGGMGLYILDEPEAALSPQRQLTFLLEIERCVREGSQFIIVSHSPILLAYPEADIISFDGELHRIDYEETESYKLTSLFINDRARLLHNLFDE